MIGVSEDGYREILDASESKECWRNILVRLRIRSLKYIRLFTSDRPPGLPGIGLGGVPRWSVSADARLRQAKIRSDKGNEKGENGCSLNLIFMTQPI